MDILEKLEIQLKDYEKSGCKDSPFYAALKEKVELMNKEVLK